MKTSLVQNKSSGVAEELEMSMSYCVAMMDVMFGMLRTIFNCFQLLNPTQVLIPRKTVGSSYGAPKRGRQRGCGKGTPCHEGMLVINNPVTTVFVDELMIQNNFKEFFNVNKY